MTAILERPGTVVGTRSDRTLPWVRDHAVVLLALGVVALRLPFVAAAPGADEAGFLAVARQWQPGTSLYGDLWVDRPPLLVSIFRVAAELGGLVPLRIIGALAAALVVTGAARVARQVAGDRAALGAALTAAALCLSPLMGATEVNGELLAAPFVVGGLSAVVAALRTDTSLTARACCAIGAGAAFAGAVLVKQNFLDVGVFAAAALASAVARREVTLGRAVRLSVGFAGGAVLATAVLAGWTVLHGTSLVGVYDAMYPFRLAAAKALAGTPNPAPRARLVLLLVGFAMTLVPALLVLVLRGLSVRRIGGSAVWGLVALLCFDGASVLAGGNYWSHYLVQLVVPVSVLAGVLLAARQRGTALVVGAVVVAGVAAWGVHAPPATSQGSRLGDAIGEVAQPGDSIVTIYGHADVTYTSGLTSPYPYLWSLPLKVRDPQEELLEQTLSSTRAPTWFVVWSHVSSVGVDATATQRLLAENYHPVAVIEGHTVYLHNGVGRADPVPEPDINPGRRSTP